MTGLIQRVRIVLATPVLVGLLATCDKPPTVPTPAHSPPTEAARPLISTELSVALGNDVDDVLTRVLPVLGNADAIAPLVKSFGALRKAVAARDVGAIMSSRSAARAAVEAFSRGDREAVTPDLAVVRLLLEQIDVVGANPPTNR